MRRCVTAAGAMSFRKMRLSGFGVMQRVRGVQRRSRGRTRDNTNQGYSNRPKARQLHPVNIPSTVDFVLYVCPGAAHLVLAKPYLSAIREQLSGRRRKFWLL
jgi:hypothetical protein